MFFIYLARPAITDITTYSTTAIIPQNIITTFCNEFNANINYAHNQSIQYKIKQYQLNYIVHVLITPQQPHKQKLYALAQEYNIDAFYIKASNINAFEQTQLIAMDMDSTLINIECIDEIADLAEVKEQVAAITHATMQGSISNFTDSLRKRVSFLKDIPFALLNDIYQKRLQLSKGAEHFLAQAKQKKIYTMLLSGGFTFFSEKLKQRLNFNEAHANILGTYNNPNNIMYLSGEVEGIIIDGTQKANLFKQAMHTHAIAAQHTMAIGDGSNDLPMMHEAGVSVAYQAKPSVEEYADIAIRVCGLDILLLA